MTWNPPDPTDREPGQRAEQAAQARRSTMQAKSRVAKDLCIFATETESEAAAQRRNVGLLSPGQDQALVELIRAATKLYQASDAIVVAETLRDRTLDVDASDRLEYK